MMLFAHSSFSQISTTIGQEFYFNFLPNLSFTWDYEMTVHLTAEVTTSGSVEVLGSSFRQEFTINGGSSLEIVIPSDYQITDVGKSNQKVVYVNTAEDVTAYAYNHYPGFSDGSILLPLQSLDKEYLVHVKGDDTQFTVLATDNDTDIEIILSANIAAIDGVEYQSGDTLRYTLDRGELVLIQSGGDLSATQVRVVDDGTVDCKKIAVFVANGPDNTQDHRFSQLYAVRDWGREYFAILFGEPHDSGIIYIMGSEDNTVLDVSGVPTRMLQRGETFVIHAEIEHYIKANKPISVLHTGAGVMNLLSPLKQISKDILFEVIGRETIEDQFLSIFTPSERLNVKLDGVDISGQFEEVQLVHEYSFAVVPVEAGVHRLEANDGAVAFTYGFGPEEAAAYAIGGNLGNFEITLENLNSSLPDGQTCAGSDLRLEANAENQTLTELYTEFQWDMGDGTIINGPEVIHQYDEPGDYVITLFASKSPLACSDLTVSRGIEVMDAAIDAIVGPEAVCPNVGPIEYLLAGSEVDYTYDWVVVGGDLISSSGPEAVVEWTFGAPLNQLKAVSTSPLGCVSDTVYMDIQYNAVLEPTLPLGPSSVCGDFKGIAYAVPLSAGSVYNWTAEGGTVVSGQGTNDIIVDWDGPGSHELWYTENSTTNTDVCEGTSERLTVIVSQAIDVEISTSPVSCFGQNDGTASVSVSGGVGPYEIEWMTGSQQSTISGLAGGTYEVVITDAVGCKVTHMAVVEEPEILSGHVVAIDATCSNNTGRAEAVVTGGSGNYSYLWQHDFTTNPVRTGLGEGTYSVRVRDDRGCELVLNYSIAVPQPMTASFEEERPCPGVNEGRLQVFVDGGSAPYSYAWEFAPGIDANSLEELPGGTYNLVVTDAEGCSMSISTELIDLEPLISMPNSFSPNGDGMNERFQAVYNCATDFQMYIYSQWGTLVYASYDIGQGWDGTYEGETVPSGDYAYHIIYNTGHNGAYKESVKGRVRLFR